MQCSSNEMKIALIYIIQFDKKHYYVSLVRNKLNIMISIDSECILQWDLSGYTLLYDYGASRTKDMTRTKNLKESVLRNAKSM